jgi:hypothetical protein
MGGSHLTYRQYKVSRGSGQRFRDVQLFLAAARGFYLGLCPGVATASAFLAVGVFKTSGLRTRGIKLMPWLNTERK